MIDKLKRKLWSFVGFILYHTDSNILEVEHWTPYDWEADEFAVRGLCIHKLGDKSGMYRGSFGLVIYYKNEVEYLSQTRAYATKVIAP